MTEDNFVDYVSLNVRSGNGGRGSSHLRREKFIAKGGPDGGDGGNGGDIVFQGDANIWTLYTFKFKKHFKAGHGGDGGRNNRSGKKGQNIIIKVPVGTTILEKKQIKLWLRSQRITKKLFCFVEDSEEEVTVILSLQLIELPDTLRMECQERKWLSLWN